MYQIGATGQHGRRKAGEWNEIWLWIIKPGLILHPVQQALPVVHTVLPGFGSPTAVY